MNIRLSRRQLAGMLAVLAGGTAAAFWAMPHGDHSSLELVLPEPGDHNAPSFEVFAALSRIVMLRADLDLDLARRMYSVFMAEPWGPKHIGTAYARLRQAIIARSKVLNDAEPVPLDDLDSGEKWFVSHLLVTWYLGVYYHEQRPTQRITLDGALMFDAVRGLMPKPFIEDVGFGAWADVPPGIDKRKL
jgi:hypothetical protein